MPETVAKRRTLKALPLCVTFDALAGLPTAAQALRFSQLSARKSLCLPVTRLMGAFIPLGCREIQPGVREHRVLRYAATCPVLKTNPKLRFGIPLYSGLS
jgi:hypothetical protein